MVPEWLERKPFLSLSEQTESEAKREATIRQILREPSDCPGLPSNTCILKDKRLHTGSDFRRQKLPKKNLESKAGRSEFWMARINLPTKHRNLGTEIHSSSETSWVTWYQSVNPGWYCTHWMQEEFGREVPAPAQAGVTLWELVAAYRDFGAGLWKNEVRATTEARKWNVCHTTLNSNIIPALVRSPVVIGWSLFAIRRFTIMYSQAKVHCVCNL